MWSYKAGWAAGLLSFAILLASVSAQTMDTYGSWKTGRATFYGTDAWSIHNGGCAYGHLGANEPLGWNIAAMSDANPLYASGVCGFCLEVKCNPMTFTDNYGSYLDRRSACYNSGNSVVVRITDTCPCTYSDNAYSNKRWCCGDMDHLDLSYIAYQRLADQRWGVIGISYRQVPCSYSPPQQAPAAQYTDWNMPGTPPLRDWPEYMQPYPQPVNIFSSTGFGSGWYLNSWNTYVVPTAQTRTAGIHGESALCAKISNNGALAIAGNQGAFAGRTKISFWMYVGVTGSNGASARVADITIGVWGPQGGCSTPRIWAVHPTQFLPSCTYCTDYWWFYEFHLAGFWGGDPKAPMYKNSFSGCGGNSASQISRIEFRHDGFGGSGDKYVCLARIGVH